MRVVFLGDIVGKAGRLAVRQYLPQIKEEYAPDVVIANGENIAGGIGMTCETLDELFSFGIDLVTSGNHVWRHKEIFSRLEKDRRIIRPLNYPPGTPGRGWLVHTLADERRLVLINLLGTVYMDPVPCPFKEILSHFEGAEDFVSVCREHDALMQEMESVAVRIVDFHAEATGEKKTMGWALDGKVSAVLGTHTHVQTADAQLLPKGTAYISDAGMCGVEQSSLGMDFEPMLQRFLTNMPHAFKPARGKISLNGVYVDIDDETGFAREIRIIRSHCPPAVL
ncbi:MAG: YmdB family metallophosphoesterase [Mailhella sp.]